MSSIRRNDTVQVRAGKDRGKQGLVRTVITKKDRVIVDGVNMMKKHQRPTQQGGVPVPGSVVTREAPLHVSNVMLVCSDCGKATRASSRVRPDGVKVRVCKRCGADID
ncbi:MAG TPA: 50S ribosomal protein L24 [Dehalococcoidia bacterium]|nr:50S ribosomal protein L24 [Dehalococcoidia bacterium]